MSCQTNFFITTHDFTYDKFSLGEQGKGYENGTEELNPMKRVSTYKIS